MSRRCGGSANRVLMGTALGVAAAAACASLLTVGRPVAAAASSEPGIAGLQAKIAELERRIPPPELGRQMLELQIRHDRLWWAGDAGNWNLAYYMASELGEALRGIEQTNGDAAELQPQRLAEVMPTIMNPAIRGMQEALAGRDKGEFATAYDRLSGACNACHAAAGAGFLHVQRPRTPLLDNLRYAPDASP